MNTENKETVKDSANAPTSVKKTLKGKVMSKKMTGTVVVAVERYVKHPVYGKYQRITKRYKADEAGEKVELGDEVLIQSCRPISRDKHFKLLGKTKSNS